MEHQVRLLCIHCAGDDLIKFGCTSNGTQRYHCNKCRRTFLECYKKEAYKPGVKDKIVDMATDGVGVRATARLLGINQNTVMSTLKKKAR